MRQLRHDAVRDSILSRTLPRRLEMESSCVRIFVRRDRIRCVRSYGYRGSRAACPNLVSRRNRKEIRANNRDRRACAKLDLSASALAELLEAP